MSILCIQRKKKYYKKLVLIVCVGNKAKITRALITRIKRLVADRSYLGTSILKNNLIIFIFIYKFIFYNCSDNKYRKGFTYSLLRIERHDTTEVLTKH